MLDASFAVKWHLRDEDFIALALAARLDFVEDRVRFVGPNLLHHEVTAAILKATRNPDRRQRIALEIARQEVRAFQGWGIPTIPSERLAPIALEIAARLGCSYYDAVYLALSQETGLPVLYADNKLRRAIGSRFPLALWIEDYRPLH